MQVAVNGVNEGIQVAIVELTGVDGAERRFRSLLLEFVLHPLHQCDSFVAGADWPALAVMADVASHAMVDNATKTRNMVAVPSKKLKQ